MGTNHFILSRYLLVRISAVVSDSEIDEYIQKLEDEGHAPTYQVRFLSMNFKELLVDLIF
jgi:hypothetical protein